MVWLQRPLRRLFEWLETLLDRIFTPAWNPLYHLGALGFFYFWIVAVSGIYLYILFDTGTTEAYESIEYMTVEQWYLGGIMRSLHRYASDGMVLMMVIHVLHEFALDRYRGTRWFTWVTGVPVLWLVLAAGITGYWMVWDQLAQYVAQVSALWLDWLPIFGEPVARNFMSPVGLDDRFFTLLTFMHIAVPLFLLLVLWIHLQRVSRPRINPPRGLAVGTFLMMMVLSLVHPAVSQGPADLAKVTAEIGLDWFYLAVYPLIDLWSSGPVWGFVVALSLIALSLPWLPPLRAGAVAVVHLDNCNGCTRCAEDCPTGAIIMAPRSDALPFDREAQVDPDLCVSCGICVGACPTATPFRRASALVPGIELPDRSLAALREQVETACTKLSGGNRVLVFGCEQGAEIDGLGGPETAAVRLPCVGALPPSFIDYALSRGLAEGVVLASCREGGCFHRFGLDWTEARIARSRDPYLRSRVPRERLCLIGAASGARAELARRVAAFAASLKSLPQQVPPPARAAARPAPQTAEAAADG